MKAIDSNLVHMHQSSHTLVQCARHGRTCATACLFLKTSTRMFMMRSAYSSTSLPNLMQMTCHPTRKRKAIAFRARGTRQPHRTDDC